MEKPETKWPLDPTPEFLGEWASENDHLVPDPFNLHMVEKIYHQHRNFAAPEIPTE